MADKDTKSNKNIDRMEQIAAERDNEEFKKLGRQSNQLLAEIIKAIHKEFEDDQKKDIALLTIQQQIEHKEREKTDKIITEEKAVLEDQKVILVDQLTSSDRIVSAVEKLSIAPVLDQHLELPIDPSSISEEQLIADQLKELNRFFDIAGDQISPISLTSISEPIQFSQRSIDDINKQLSMIDFDFGNLERTNIGTDDQLEDIEHSLVDLDKQLIAIDQSIIDNNQTEILDQFQDKFLDIQQKLLAETTNITRLLAGDRLDKKEQAFEQHRDQERLYDAITDLTLIPSDTGKEKKFDLFDQMFNNPNQQQKQRKGKGGGLLGALNPAKGLMDGIGLAIGALGTIGAGYLGVKGVEKLFEVLEDVDGEKVAKNVGSVLSIATDPNLIAVKQNDLGGTLVELSKGLVAFAGADLGTTFLSKLSGWFGDSTDWSENLKINLENVQKVSESLNLDTEKAKQFGNALEQLGIGISKFSSASAGASIDTKIIDWFGDSNWAESLYKNVETLTPILSIAPQVEIEGDQVSGTQFTTAIEDLANGISIFSQSALKTAAQSQLINWFGDSDWAVKIKTNIEHLTDAANSLNSLEMFDPGDRFSAIGDGIESLGEAIRSAAIDSKIVDWFGDSNWSETFNKNLQNFAMIDLPDNPEALEQMAKGIRTIASASSDLAKSSLWTQGSGLVNRLTGQIDWSEAIAQDINRIISAVSQTDQDTVLAAERTAKVLEITSTAISKYATPTPIEGQMIGNVPVNEYAIGSVPTSTGFQAALGNLGTAIIEDSLAFGRWAKSFFTSEDDDPVVESKEALDALSDSYQKFSDLVSDDRKLIEPLIKHTEVLRKFNTELGSVAEKLIMIENPEFKFTGLSETEGLSLVAEAKRTELAIAEKEQRANGGQAYVDQSQVSLNSGNTNVNHMTVVSPSYNPVVRPESAMFFVGGS